MHGALHIARMYLPVIAIYTKDISYFINITSYSPRTISNGTSYSIISTPLQNYLFIKTPSLAFESCRQMQYICSPIQGCIICSCTHIYIYIYIYMHASMLDTAHAASKQNYNQFIYMNASVK